MNFDPSYLLALALISAIVSAVIWSNKGGQAATGFIFGLALGLFGLAIAIFAKPSAGGFERECPFCRRRIRRNASVCPYCQRESQAWEYRDGKWWAGNHWLDERTNEWKSV